MHLRSKPDEEPLHNHVSCSSICPCSGKHDPNHFATSMWPKTNELAATHSKTPRLQHLTGNQTTFCHLVNLWTFKLLWLLANAKQLDENWVYDRLMKPLSNIYHIGLQQLQHKRQWSCKFSAFIWVEYVDPIAFQSQNNAMSVLGPFQWVLSVCWLVVGHSLEVVVGSHLLFFQIQTQRLSRHQWA